MASEAALWTVLRGRLSGGLNHVVRVENSVEVGTPDVYYRIESTAGWMELKHLHEWPKRESTIVRIDHYTDEQRQWLLREVLAGGDAWLLLQVSRTYLLFDGISAQDVGRATQSQLRRAACAVWERSMDRDELRAILINGINGSNK